MCFHIRQYMNILLLDCCIIFPTRGDIRLILDIHENIMVSSVLGGVFLLAVIQTSLPSARAHNTYYVKPTNDTQCPGEPCLTLSQYIQESGKYFISNTTMLFLPGEHQLDSTFLVENVASFALQGDTSSLPELPSKVFCNSTMGNFQFSLVQQLDIRALHFFLCSLNEAFIGPLGQAIFVLITEDFHLETCILELNPSEALYLDSITNGSLLNNTFVGNEAISEGAAITVYGSTVTFSNNSFSNNKVNLGGGAIYAQDSSLNFNATNIFFNNIAFLGFGGALLAINTTIVLSGNIDFVDNSALSGGAVFLLSSVLYLNGNVSFRGNLAVYGGGAVRMLTDELIAGVDGSTSKFYLNPNTTMNFWKNSATDGGAVYVEDINPLKYCPEATGFNCRQDDCFFQVLDQNVSTGFSSKLEFVSNSAVESGDAVWGGNIDHCSLIGLPASNSSEVFDMITTFEQPQTASVISSVPLQICGCENGYPNCTRKNRYHEVYPGETFVVTNIVAVGQRDGTVPANILSFYKNTRGNGRFGDFETEQKSSRKCGDHHYTVFTLVSSRHTSFNLYPRGPCPISSGNPLNISVQIRPCPTGFVLSPTTGGCVCEDRLMTYTNSCNITEQTIFREGTFWVGYDNASESLILSPHCPFDYCRTEPVQFTLNNSILQCAYNRSGLLCGSCQPDLSLVLGSNRCLRCSNNYLSLLIVFAVAGFILVLFLLACKLTVASGTINGLVFYANVVSLNKSIFFPPNAINPLTLFIAWINLDLGIETCFYDVMDSYAKTWLQFVFPPYIWALVGLIIILSKFSHRLTRLLGSNPVAVLATLFLLSFTRLLGTITSVLAFTRLDYVSHTETVWILDGEVAYLRKKHTALAVVAILAFFILFLPYTLVILFGQWLLKSKRKVFSWISKPQIRSILDAYYAPYKEEYRYWPGMLLALRFVMLLIYVSTSLTNVNANLLTIAVATLGLELWAWIGKQVYRHKYLDILEGSFIFNLGLLAAITFYVRVAGGNQAAVVYTSVSVAFVTFIGILTYHAFQQLQRWGYCLTYPKLNIRTKSVNITDTSKNPSQAESKPSPTVPYTYMNYRESLLASQ